ncbi:MAG: protein kinase [Myxococcales bacterium]|nr:protein kinase [Myxococcales bacterium]MCB9643276.1 protein kinase [Myxococcales bacterium]
MIACPHCGYAHPKHLTASQCLQCGNSFADFYLCSNNSCQYHQVFQPTQRECRGCTKTLIGEFSGRLIPWGHAIYRVREYIGGGGMGEVYRAVEQDQTGTFEREVAIKFNKNVMDQEIVRRFHLEVQILSMLQNPHNIRVYTHGELFEERATGVEVRAQFMVMELLRGNTLNEITKAGRLPPEQAVPIFVEVCGALAEAHSKDIIHRDLKPHNIMLQTVSGDYFAKVFDFGLSRLTTSMDDRLSTSGVVMGTFRYMSPEQALGEDVDQRTDIFSLGVVLYEVLTGHHPFPAENLFELFMLHQNPLPPMQAIEPELAAIVTKALYYEKDRRFQSMEEMRMALQVWQGDSVAGRVTLSQILKEYKDYQKESQSRLGISGFQRSLSPSGRHISLPGMQLPPQQPPPQSNKAVLIGGVLGGFLLVFGLGFAAIKLLSPPTEINRPLTVITPPREPARPIPRPQPLQRPEIRVGSAEPIPRVQPHVEQPKHPKTHPVVRNTRRKRRKRRRPFYRHPHRTRVVEPRPVVRQPDPVIPRPPVERIPPVIRRPVLIARITPRRVEVPPPRPRLPSCPSQSKPVTYRQLDKVMGSSFNMRIARVLNRASGGSVYDAGLTLSQSWRNARVICKVSYLCDKITAQVQRYCVSYQPYPHCSGYRARKVQRGERVLFVCRR